MNWNWIDVFARLMFWRMTLTLISHRLHSHTYIEAVSDTVTKLLGPQERDLRSSWFDKEYERTCLKNKAYKVKF